MHAEAMALHAPSNHIIIREPDYLARENLDDITGNGRSESLVNDGFEPLCNARDAYIQPRWANNTKNEPKFIVNGRDEDSDNPVFARLRHHVNVRTCLDADQECPLQTGGGQYLCKQVYTTHKLLALGTDENQNEIIAEDDFAFPTYCACHHRTNDLLRN